MDETKAVFIGVMTIVIAAAAVLVTLIAGSYFSPRYNARVPTPITEGTYECRKDGSGASCWLIWPRP